MNGWLGGEREAWVDRNLALQAIDPAALDDGELARHLGVLDDHLVAGWMRHHELHGSDLGPIGDLLAHGAQWGLEPVAVMELLSGGSPATLEGRAYGRRMAEALAAAGTDPATVTTLAEVRAVPAAAEALDAYLEMFGWRVVTSYDLEGLTIGELPSATCALDPGLRHRRRRTGRPRSEPRCGRSCRRATGPASTSCSPMPAAPTGCVTTTDRSPRSGRWGCCGGRSSRPAAGWPSGVASPTVVTCSSSTRRRSPAALQGAPAPDADEIARRADRRVREAAAAAPNVLGPAMEPPDTSVFPRGIRRVMNIILAAVSNLEADPAVASSDLRGLGIGSGVYRGIARVATDPDQVLEAMEPGDVLVAPWTAPTYNAVLAIAGAIVVQEGGLLSHAAVMARELGIPAVIGCRGAMDADRRRRPRRRRCHRWRGPSGRVTSQSDGRSAALRAADPGPRSRDQHGVSPIGIDRCRPLP